MGTDNKTPQKDQQGSRINPHATDGTESTQRNKQSGTDVNKQSGTQQNKQSGTRTDDLLSGGASDKERSGNFQRTPDQGAGKPGNKQ